MELAKAFNREKQSRRGVMRRLALVGWILVLCLAVGFGASTASGQAVYGSIIGTVTDPQGNAVAGAKVTVTSITKNTSDETTTNESGNYSVIHLIPDTYRDRKSTRLNSSHSSISYAVFCLKKKT